MTSRDTYDISQFDCVECGINTLDIFEYYMLKNEIWDLAGVDQGMLCVSCFEKKSDIVLTASHFTDYPINTGNFLRSQLLQSRLNN